MSRPWSDAERKRFGACLRRYQVVPGEPGRRPSRLRDAQVYREWSEAKRDAFEASTSCDQAVSAVERFNAEWDAWEVRRAAREGAGARAEALACSTGSVDRLMWVDVASGGTARAVDERRVEWNMRRLARAAPVLVKCLDAPKMGASGVRGRALVESPVWRARRLLEIQNVRAEVRKRNEDQLVEWLRSLSEWERLDLVAPGAVNLFAPELRLVDVMSARGFVLFPRKEG